MARNTRVNRASNRSNSFQTMKGFAIAAIVCGLASTIFSFLAPITLFALIPAGILLAATITCTALALKARRYGDSFSPSNPSSTARISLSKCCKRRPRPPIYGNNINDDLLVNPLNNPGMYGQNLYFRRKEKPHAIHHEVHAHHGLHRPHGLHVPHFQPKHHDVHAHPPHHNHQQHHNHVDVTHHVHPFHH